MKNFFLNIIFVIINLKEILNEQSDIFNISKNLRFCGKDLFSKNLTFPILKGKKHNKSRSLIHLNINQLEFF